ncbi:uncharacterized protein LOC135829731 [Sycon ciliatum]|uniref:uncharacterized protein LOC135829731 n=1 Tax=Sycon ciliatum TaxID=27933 RepID=UPI0031F60FAA
MMSVCAAMVLVVAIMSTVYLKRKKPEWTSATSTTSGDGKTKVFNTNSSATLCGVELSESYCKAGGEWAPPSPLLDRASSKIVSNNYSAPPPPVAVLQAKQSDPGQTLGCGRNSNQPLYDEAYECIVPPLYGGAAGSPQEMDDKLVQLTNQCWEALDNVPRYAVPGVFGDKREKELPVPAYVREKKHCLIRSLSEPIEFHTDKELSRSYGSVVKRQAMADVPALAKFSEAAPNPAYVISKPPSRDGMNCPTARQAWEPAAASGSKSDPLEAEAGGGGECLPPPYTDLYYEKRKKRPVADECHGNYSVIDKTFSQRAKRSRNTSTNNSCNISRANSAGSYQLH